MQTAKHEIDLLAQITEQFSKQRKPDEKLIKELFKTELPATGWQKFKVAVYNLTAALIKVFNANDSSSLFAKKSETAQRATRKNFSEAIENLPKPVSSEPRKK